MINNLQKIRPAWGMLLGSLLISGAAQAEITCTATPDCNSLGYTQTSCEGGGIRCPFDAGKMFCIKDGAVGEYQFQNAISKYQVAYSDGVTSSSWFASRDPIGIVFYVHPNGARNHGLVMSLQQFTAQNRDDAIKLCAAYVTKGTQPGDWHLADMGELFAVSAGDERTITNEYDQLQTFLSMVPGAKQLGFSGSVFYTDSSSYDYYSDKNYIAGGVDTTYSRNVSSYYLSASDYNSSTMWMANLSSTNGSGTVGNTYAGHFRCVALF